MRIGLIGIGAIGSFVAKELEDSVAWVYDADLQKAEKKKAELSLGFEVLGSIDERLLKSTDIVVECASQNAVKLLFDVLEHCDVMIVSVGALADGELLASLKQRAMACSHKILIPSGAIAGIDAIKSFRNIKSSLLETIKNPKSLGRVDEKRTEIFKGSAREACKLFPKNVNVSATLSLAGIGFEKTQVMIISDPAITRNTHRIRVVAEEGELELTIASNPMPGNPCTSHIAALSVVRALKEIDSGFRIV